jgi:hypothetical protein
VTIDPTDAAASLQDIAQTERRTRESIRYAISASCLILWGALTSLGYVLTYLFPREAPILWIIITVIGFLGNVAVVFSYFRQRADGPRERLLLIAMLVLAGYGALWLALFSPVAARQISAFWPSLVMFGFVTAGLWLGRFFIVSGIFGTALIIVGFLWSGPWFDLWMAVVQGVVLILGGLYLRRIGTPP